MASQDFNATDDPQALETVLGLSDGTRYWLEVTDTINSLRLRIAAAKPSVRDRAHHLQTGQGGVIAPEAGLSTWCWTTDGETCSIIVTEAP